MNSCFVCTEDCSGRAAEDGAEKDAAIALHQALIHEPGNAALTHCVCCRCFADETGTVGTNDLFPLDRYALVRSEEHTSELQSLMRISYAVFCLTKKNKK